MPTNKQFPECYGKGVVVRGGLIKGGVATYSFPISSVIALNTNHLGREGRKEETVVAWLFLSSGSRSAKDNR